MPLPYRDLLEQYERAKAFGDTRSIDEWAKGMNQMTGSQDYSPAVGVGAFRRGSVHLSQMLEQTVGQVTALPFESAGTLVGRPEAGRRIGEGLPRNLLDTAGLFVAPEATLPVLLGTGAAMGANTYGETGDVSASLIAGGIGAALPGVSRIAGNAAAELAGAQRFSGQLGMDAFGAAKGEAFTGIIPTTTGQRLAQFGGSQAAQFGLNAASTIAGGQNPFTQEGFIDFALGQIPFTAHDLMNVSRAKGTTEKSLANIGLTPGGPKPAPEVPKVVDLPKFERTNAEQAQVEAAIQMSLLTSQNPGATPEQKAAATSALIKGVMTPEQQKVVEENNLSPVVKPPGQPASLLDEVKVQVGGHYEQIEPGRYRVRLDNVPENLPDLQGKTAFVSGEPVNGQFTVGLKDLRNGVGQVKFPFAAPKVGLDPNLNPELSARPDGVSPTSIGLTEMGVAPVEGVDLSSHVADYEQAKSAEESARAQSAVVPTKPDEVFSLTGQTLNPTQLETLRASGKNNTQIFETERLKAQTPVVDTAQVQQNVAKKRAKILTGEDRKQALETGQSMLAAYEQVAKTEDPENPGPASRVVKAITTALKGQDIQDPKVSERLYAVLFKWSRGEYLTGGSPDSSIGRLEKALGKAAQTAARPPVASRGPGLPGADGKVTHTDRAAAEVTLQAYEAAHPQEKGTYEVTGAGEGKFRVQKKVTNQTASLNQKVGEGEVEIQDLVAAGDANEPVVSVPVGERPAVSKNSLQAKVEALIKTPAELAELMNEGEPTDSQIEDVQHDLRRMNEFLKLSEEQGPGTPSFFKTLNEKLAEEGLEKFEDVQDMQHSVKNMGHWLAEHSNVYRNFTLGSTVPHDPAIVEAMGGGRDAAKIVEWSQTLKDMPAVLRDLLSKYLAFRPELRNVRHILPGDEGWNQKFGWAYGDMRGIDPSIHIPWMPTQDNAAKWAMNYAHELTHFVAKDLYERTDPAAMEFRKALKEVLEDLRNSPQLPKKIRQLLQLSVKEDHVGQFVSGKLTQEELRALWLEKGGPAIKDYLPIVYGLQNEHELLAQLFGSPEMVSLVATTPRRQSKVGTLSWLSGLWSKMTGAQPTALEELLRGYDNYLTGGILKKTYNGMDYLRDKLMANGTRAEAFASRLQTIDRTFARGTLEASLAGWKREQENGILPATSHAGEESHVEQTIRTASTSVDAPKRIYQSVMNATADQIPYLQDLHQRMKEDVETTRALAKEIRDGRIVGEVPKVLDENLKKSSVVLNAFSRALTKQEHAIQRFEALQTFSDEGRENQIIRGLFEPKWAGPPEEVPDAAELREKMGIFRAEGGKTLGPIEKNFMLSPHLQSVHPELRDVSWGLMDEQMNAHERGARITEQIVWDPEYVNPVTGKKGGPSPEVKASHDRVVASERLNQAVSDLMRWQNTEERVADMSDPQVRGMMRGFTAEDQKAVFGLRDALMRAKVARDAFFVETQQKKNIFNAATVIAGLDGVLPSQAKEVASRLYNAVVDMQDPQKAQQGAAALQAVSQMMKPETFLKSLEMAQRLTGRLSEVYDFISSRPWHSTEQRFDDNMLRMVGPSGEGFRASFKTMEELNKARLKQEQQGFKLLSVSSKDDQLNSNSGVDEEVLNRIDALDAESEDVVRQAFANQPDVLNAVLPRLQRSEDLRRQLAAQTGLPAARRGVAGREYLDMVQNEQRWTSKLNHLMTHQLVRARSTLERMHPEIQTNPELAKFSDQMVQNFLTPDNPFFRKVAEATYFYRLAFDMGQAMIEWTQNLTTGMQSLISATGSYGDAFKYWKKATTALTNWVTNGRKWDSEEHGRLAHELSVKGQAGMMTYSDIVDPAHETMMNAQFQEKKGVVGNALGAVATKARNFSTMFQRMNSRVIAFAAFDFAREQGMNYDDAFRFAVEAKSRGLYDSGKAQRAVGLWSIKTKAVPQVMSSLTTYTLGWFGQLATDVQRGWGSTSRKLTESEKSGARKAALYALGAQALLAGALGLPGVGQGMALFNQITGIDLKGMARQKLAGMFDEDQDYGGTLTNLALRGVGAAALPFDPSNRLAISVPFIGVDPYKGFDKANLLGAVGGSIGDFIQGLIEVGRGDTAGFARVLPNALKRPFQLWQGEGDVRDQRGALLQTLSPVERAFMAAGLPPSKVTTAREVADSLDKIRDNEQRRKEKFSDDLARLVRTGNTDEVKAKLIAEYQRDPANFNLDSIRQNIAKRVEAQTIPYDWRREITRGDLSGLVQPNASTESARLGVRDSVIQSLGGRPTTSPSAHYQATLVDQLLDSNPLMTRSEALRQVGSLLRSPRRNSDLGFLGLQ